MRIKSTTLTSFATAADDPARPPERVGTRAARLRETLENGLYQVNLDKLADRLVATAQPLTTDESDDSGCEPAAAAAPVASRP